MDLYAAKRRTLERLEPLVERLAASGVAPDTLTLAAMPVAFASAVCLLASPGAPLLLLAVPVLAALRLTLNLLDGAVARRTARGHPRGELLNEVVDRIADVLFLAPAAFLPAASSPVVLLGVLGAVLASFVGLAARAAGGDRIYRGVLSKPGRMALLAACSLVAIVSPALAWGAFGPLLLLGTVLTVGERTVVAVRRLP